MHTKLVNITSRICHSGKMIYAIIMCLSAIALTGCDQIQLITQDSSGGMNGEVSQSETADDSDSWKTAILTDESGNPKETSQTEETISDETTVAETEESYSDTAVPETSASELEESQPETTTVETEETTTGMISEEHSVFEANFDATVLSVERKYIVVKPDVKSDEFEESRKIKVYVNTAPEFSIGDEIIVSYSGKLGSYEDDMPTIESAELELVKEGEDVPDIIQNTYSCKVEIIRTYTDGLLVELAEDSGELSEGDRVSINVRDGLIFEKGAVLEIQYSSEIIKPDNDYPVLTVDNYEIVASPTGIIGEIESVNDKGCVISYIKGSLELDEGATIIVIDDNAKNYSEGDRVKFVFTDILEDEPYILSNVLESILMG